MSEKEKKIIRDLADKLPTSIMQIRQNRLRQRMASVTWKYGKMDIYIYPVQKILYRVWILR